MRYGWLVAISVLLIVVFGCGSSGRGSEMVYVERVRPLDSLPVVETGVAVSFEQNLSPTVVPANPRLWQPAGLEYFSFPIMFLERRLPEDLVFVSKQVGPAILFCLIKPDAVMYKSRKKSAEYTVFLARKVSPREFEMIPAGYAKSTGLRLADREVVLLNTASDAFGDTPRIFAKLDGGNYEISLIYQGLSRSYADKVLNHFPWRAMVR